MPTLNRAAFISADVCKPPESVRYRTWTMNLSSRAQRSGPWAHGLPRRYPQRPTDLAWLFTHGLREHGLLDVVDAVTLAALDETPPFLCLPGDATDQPPGQKLEPQLLGVSKG